MMSKQTRQDVKCQNGNSGQNGHSGHNTNNRQHEQTVFEKIECETEGYLPSTVVSQIVFSIVFLLYGKSTLIRI